MKPFLLVLLTMSLTVKAQSYREYYQLIDSAKYILMVEKDTLKSMSLYEKAFTKFEPFRKDLKLYLQNAKVSPFSTRLMAYDQLIEGKINCKYTFRNVYDQYNAKLIRKEIKKLKKEHLFLDSTKKLLNSLIKKDQAIRKRGKGGAYEDSLIQEEFCNYFFSHPDQYRAVRGMFFTAKFEGLKIHTDFRIFTKYENELFDLLEKGLIHRSELAYLFYRESAWAGKSFDLKEGKMVETDLENKELKKGVGYHYQTLGVLRSGLIDKENICETYYDPSYITDINRLNKIRAKFMYPTLQFQTEILLSWCKEY